MPVAVAILFGLVAGKLAGGSLHALSSTEVRYPWLILAAFAVQGMLRGRLGFSASPTLGVTVWCLVSLVLAAAILANRKHAALALVGIGTLANTLVVMLNGFMPVFPGAGDDVARVVRALIASAGFYQLGSGSTALPALADVVPLALGRTVYFLSVGDLLLVSGVAAFIVGRMVSTEPGASQPASSV